MARTAVAITSLSRTGVVAGAATTSDATNGHVLANDGRTFLEIVSSDGGAQYVDVQISETVDGQAITSKRIAVAAGARVKAGPFPTNIYNQTSALAAEGTLTSDGTAPSNGDTVTVDTTVYTFRTALTEAYATGTITSDATAPADAETVTVGATTYTFKTTLTGAANEVLIGGSAANALSNLKAAINDSGVEGTNYGTGTVANASVTGGTLTATTLAVTAKTLGTAGNSVATTETSAHLSWGGSTLSGGVAAIAYEVLIGGSAANALTNLKAAIDDSGVEGTNYSTGTVAHSTVDGGALTATTLKVTATAAGTGGNAIATTETSTHLSWGAATLAGGFASGGVLLDPSVSSTLSITAFSV